MVRGFAANILALVCTQAHLLDHRFIGTLQAQLVAVPGRLS
jgi:hypothetical protein